MKDVCAITGVDKAINYKNLVPISTRGSKLIPTLQERYLVKVRAKLKEQQIERLLADREAKIEGNKHLEAGQEHVVILSEAEIIDRVELYVNSMTTKPSRNDIITLIKFQNEDIIELVTQIRAEVNS
jgi:hypothetical protein